MIVEAHYLLVSVYCELSSFFSPGKEKTKTSQEHHDKGLIRGRGERLEIGGEDLFRFGVSDLSVVVVVLGVVVGSEEVRGLEIIDISGENGRPRLRALDS
jgi:hypothetical protein